MRNLSWDSEKLKKNNYLRILKKYLKKFFLNPTGKGTKKNPLGIRSLI